MNKSSNQESSVAWFKLSQLVSRGEKEKAHGLFKLLSYSLDDKAYALQVEADLLWAFGDDGSLDKYKESAFLYKQEHKIVSAAGIYEHLSIMHPENDEFIEMLVECYARLGWDAKINKRCDTLIDLNEQGKITKDRLLKIFKLIGETYKFDNRDTSLERFVMYLKTKSKDIAGFAESLSSKK